jgi:hypothetical protein
MHWERAKQGTESRRIPWSVAAPAALLVGLIPLTFPLTAHAQKADAKKTPIARLPEIRTHFDIFAGNGKAGPYSLSFNNIRINSPYTDENPLVIVDGVTLRPEQYTIDAPKGIITFRAPLRNTSVARVSYTYDPKVSRRNGDPASTGVTVPLMKMAGTQIKVTALPGTGTPDPKDPAKIGGGGNIPLVWSAGGKMSLLGGGLSSNFNYAGNDSIGMQLGYNVGNARNGLDVQFSKADKEFATRFGRNFGMAEATQKRSLGTRLNPAKWFGATFNSVETRDFNGKGTKEQNVLALRLGVAGAGPTLAFTRNEDNTIAANKQETSVTVDKLDLSARLTKSTSVAATGLRTMTDAPSAAGDVTAEDMTITVTAVSPNQQSSAVFALNLGGQDAVASELDKQGMSLRIQPAPVFSITAEKRDQTVTPIKPDGTEGARQSSTVQSVGAEIIPMPGAKINGSVLETINNEVKVSASNLAASFGVGAVVNGAKTLEFNTGIVNRSTEVPGQVALDTTHAQFTLRANKTLTFTGGVTWNPETKGVISRVQRQEVGVNARIGILELGSGYMLNTVNGVKEYEDVDPQFGQVSLTLGIQFNRCTRLNYSYVDMLNYRSAQELPVALVPRYLKTVGLGLTHTPGNDLTFTFGGTVTENRAQPKPTDIKAEAKVGVKFD